MLYIERSEAWCFHQALSVSSTHANYCSEKLTVTQKNIVLSICSKLVKAKQFNDNLFYPEIYCNDEITLLCGIITKHF